MGIHQLLLLVASCAASIPCSSRRALLGATAAAVAGPPLISQQRAAAAAPPAFPSSVLLSDGLRFPLASFGLQVYDDATAEKLVQLALDAGFRNFFASVLARNQRGFARGVAKSKVPRDELFICGSVLSNRAQGYKAAYELSKLGCEENMRDLGVTGGINELDMIMLDYPGPDADSIRGQWRALEDMKEAGLVRSLAVSNFSPAQLDVILADPKTKHRPTVNQLPYSVGYHDPGAVAANRKRGVFVQAWSPLGSGRLTRYLRDTAEAKQLCAEVGAPYGKSASQVALRWITQSGGSGAAFTVETKSAAHFAEDSPDALFDFELSASDMGRLETLNAQPAAEGGARSR